MYYYYYLTTIGKSPWWKKYITSMQITQFSSGCVISLILLLHSMLSALFWFLPYQNLLTAAVGWSCKLERCVLLFLHGYSHF